MALSYQNYTGDNATTQFSIPFTYQDTAEISVTVNGVAETGLTFPSSSTVQLTSAPATGTLVQVRRTTNLAARAVDFASGSVLTEEDLDDSNIQVFHAAQESVDLAADSIQLGNDNKWDAQNSVIKNVGTPTASTDAATKGYTDTEVAGVVSSSVSQATTAAVAAANAAVITATGAIIPDATKIVLHPINTQYTLSDGVTTDYSSKHYANVASTNATTATNAASAASTDAGTASTAATAAQVAQAAAEAALDTFDDRFLGAKASDPSVDNDGNALLDGAIYFNTTSDIMKVYDQANTIWRDLALTGTDQTNVNLVAGQISPTNNIATVAGISADITTTATNNANITTVATSIADVNAVGTDIANVNTVATNLSSVNAFADTYFISATAPAAPTLGDLWFDTTNDIMKVYSSSGFVNAGSSVNGTANRYVYTATSGQTTFAATYDAGYIDVYLNGVKLQNGTDFTATDGANVVLTVGAALNDQIDIVGYGTFNIAIPDISGDLTPELGGDLATSGNDITFGTNDKAVFGAASDLQIYHDGGSSWVSDVGAGNLKLTSDGAGVFLQKGATEFMGEFLTDGAVRLYYDNAAKFETTNTGVDVTGSVTADGVTSSAAIVSQTGGSNSAPSIAITSGSLGVNGITAPSANTLGFVTGTAERMRIDSSGNVGIGTASPASYGRLAVMTPTANFGYFGIGNSVGGGGGVNIGSFYGTTKISYIDTVLENGTPASEQSRLQFATIAGGTLTERMRITSGGNLMVGKTSAGGTDVGHELNVIGTAYHTRDGGQALVLNRKTSDGSIVDFRRDNTAVGSIGVVGGHPQVASASGYLGIGGSTGSPFMYSYASALYPTTDNFRDLGTSGQRWDDVYATNGTIQTSDANEKQQIAALTDAEITAAKAISALFKTFKWNSAVEGKGDAARTHAGVIAQDVQAAMTAAGLDAGDYAFFISSTWWETQTEVPAVEAVEAVDAVYEDVVIPAVEEELDEDGNVIVEAQPERTEQRLVSEAIEAVEAKEAYTRTDTYDTAEEAPEGATERTRLGIRYPELLAFVGAATEQRLANIETRLTALENV